MGSQRWVFHSLEQKSSHCMLMEVQRGQSVLFRSRWSLRAVTPSVALLVHLSGTTHSTMDFQGYKHAYDASKSRPFYMYVAPSIVCLWIALEYGFYVKQKLDFSSRTITSDFCKSNHIYAIYKSV